MVVAVEPTTQEVAEAVIVFLHLTHLLLQELKQLVEP
jgi:hypothetical protein